MNRSERRHKKLDLTDESAARYAPVILLVSHQEWTARSVESVLRPAGYAVVKAYTGRQATDLALRVRPDLVIIDYRLSDVLGLDACRAIRALPTVDDATPFIIATAVDLGRRERHECFEAGIWDIFSAPFDPVELLGKLKTFLSSRREVDNAWESTHRDPVTGLYNWNGLRSRAVEIISEAQRNRRWTACVAVGHKEEALFRGANKTSLQAESELVRSDPKPEFDRIVAAVLETTRVSDATGIVGTNDFLVLAPGTDEEGAEKMARRLLAVLNNRDDLRVLRSELEFSAGYYAARDGTGGSMVAEDLLGRPMEALRSAQRADAGLRAVLQFHPA